MGSNANHTSLTGGLGAADTLTAFNGALSDLDAALVAKVANGFTQAAVFRNQQTNGTRAGASLAADWSVRTFNQIVNTGNAFYATDSNQITPDAGTYILFAICPAYKVGLHKARLKNVTAGNVTAYGSVAISPAAKNSMTNAYLLAVFAANGTDAYQVEHYTELAVASYGLGIDNSVPAIEEIYELIILINVSPTSGGSAASFGAITMLQPTGFVSAREINSRLAQLDENIGNLLVQSGSTPSVARVYDSKATTVDGGGSTGATWVQRDLNAEQDPDNIVTIAANRFTPTAGTYLVFAFAPSYEALTHKIRLVNHTDSDTVVIQGQSTSGLGSGSGFGTAAFLVGLITANGTDEYQIEHYVDTTIATNGFGLAVDDGTEENFAQVLLVQIP